MYYRFQLLRLYSYISLLLQSNYIANKLLKFKYLLFATLIAHLLVSCNPPAPVEVTAIDEIQFTGSVTGYNSIQTSIGREPTIVVSTPDSGYILAAYVFYTATLHDALVVKINKTGQMDWSQTYSGNDFNEDIIYDILVMPDSGYMLIGFTYSQEFSYYKGESLPMGSGDGWIVRTDKSGNMLWQKTFGGKSYDLLRCGLLLPDGSLLLAGETQSDMGGTQLDMGHTDNWLLQINDSGNVLLQTHTGSKGLERIYDMSFFNDSAFLLLGGTNNINNQISLDHDISLTMMHINNLDTFWSQTWGGNSWDIAYSLAINNKKQIAIAGKSESTTNTFPNKGMTDAFIASFDSTGKWLWTKNFGGSLNDYFYRLTSMGSKFIAAGLSTSFDKDMQNKPFKANDTYLNADAIIAQVNADGSTNKFHILSGSSYDAAKGICNNNSNYFVFGYTRSGDGHFKDLKSPLWYALMKE